MHLQIRTKPINSPPDVEKLLRRLAEASVNLVGAGGSDVEFGGEFAFAVDHDAEAAAFEVLDHHKYEFRKFDATTDPELTLCWLTNVPGSLQACIAGVASANLDSGRIIRDLLIGVPTDEGIPVQVFSELVRTSQNVERD